VPAHSTPARARAFRPCVKSRTGYRIRGGTTTTSPEKTRVSHNGREVFEPNSSSTYPVSLSPNHFHVFEAFRNGWTFSHWPTVLPVRLAFDHRKRSLFRRRSSTSKPLTTRSFTKSSLAPCPGYLRDRTTRRSFRQTETVNQNFPQMTRIRRENRRLRS